MTLHKLTKDLLACIGATAVASVEPHECEEGGDLIWLWLEKSEMPEITDDEGEWLTIEPRGTDRWEIWHSQQFAYGGSCLYETFKGTGEELLPVVVVYLREHSLVGARLDTSKNLITENQ